MVPHPGLDRDEAISAALLGVFLARRREPDCSDHYARQAARNAIRMDGRRTYRWWRAQRWHASLRRDRLPDHVPAVLEALDATSVLGRLRAAVDALPPPQRAVVRLRLDGLTLVQVAHRLRIHVKAATSRWNRGLARLRRGLADG